MCVCVSVCAHGVGGFFCRVSKENSFLPKNVQNCSRKKREVHKLGAREGPHARTDTHRVIITSLHTNNKFSFILRLLLIHTESVATCQTTNIELHHSQSMLSLTSRPRSHTQSADFNPVCCPRWAGRAGPNGLCLDLEGCTAVYLAPGHFLLAGFTPGLRLSLPLKRENSQPF